MENKKYEMSIKNYKVEKINYVLNSSFKPQNVQDSLAITPSLQRQIKKRDKNSALVRLSCKIHGDGLPFSVEVSVSAIFTLEDWEADEVGNAMIKQNTIAILFPFIRTLIANVTADSMLAPYILPIINIAAAFDNSNIESETKEN